jgi:hypothetical protein
MEEREEEREQEKDEEEDEEKREGCVKTRSCLKRQGQNKMIGGGQEKEEHAHLVWPLVYLWIKAWVFKRACVIFAM